MKGDLNTSSLSNPVRVIFDKTFSEQEKIKDNLERAKYIMGIAKQWKEKSG